MRLGKRRTLETGRPEYLAEKESVRAQVEHPFLKVKRIFDYGKVRYRGLAKNTQRLALLLGLGNLMTAENWRADTWRPAGPNPSVRRLRARYSPRRGRNHRAKTISGSGKRCLTYRNAGPRTKRPAEPNLVQGILSPLL